MNIQRRARADVAEMDRTHALPRKSGELVFHDEWERRAFAIAVSLAERGLYEWGEFQRELIKSIADAEGHDAQNPSRGYYESWLVSLEALLREKDLLNPASS